jgi:hypothetical protein
MVKFGIYLRENFFQGVKIFYILYIYLSLIMNSISEKCNDLKKSYDACFNSWYTEKFLQGETNSEPCRELFESYRACVLVSHHQRMSQLSWEVDRAGRYPLHFIYTFYSSCWPIKQPDRVMEISWWFRNQYWSIKINQSWQPIEWQHSPVDK